MFAIRSTDSVTVILRGKPYTVASDHGRYADLTNAINDKDEATVDAIVNSSTAVTEVLGTFGDVQLFAGHVTFKGKSVGDGNFLASRILAFQEAGQDVEPLARFMNSVCRNPDQRAIRDLFRWCDASKMPIDEQGRIIGYKIVNHDFTDCYRGTFDNTPGTTQTMRREDCDPNPSQTCSRGLHFCSASYLPHYGPSNKKVVLAAIEPEHVVAFPTDYGLAKARACRTHILHEIDPATAATFFEGRDQLVYDADSYFREQYEASEAARVRDERVAAAQAAGWTVEVDEDGDYIVREPGGEYFNLADTEIEAWDTVLEEVSTRAEDAMAAEVQAMEPEPEAPAEPVAEARFYLRTPAGYWKAPGVGYTNDVSEAHVYTESEIPSYAPPHAERVPVTETEPAAEPVTLETDASGSVTGGVLEGLTLSTANITLAGAVSGGGDGTLVVTNLTTTQVAPALSLGERLDRIERQLGIPAITDGTATMAGRLDLIEREMGITEPLSPLVARVERAERQLSL